VTIILDLNARPLRALPVRFESAPVDTVMVITTFQDLHTDLTNPSSADPMPTAISESDNDQDITWEDAEWQ